ncbi:MAG TPA: chloride channel protein [Acidobacteriaceae bacterium]|jgi:H+/Cl- antiporter ClcA
MKSHSSTLRDFTVDRRVWLISALAIIVGIGGAGLAVILLRLIAFFTNLFYYHRFSLAMVGPAGSTLGYWMVLVPIVGGVIVGIMARYGSDKIRGHGIPEAIEAILLNGARVEPRVAVLKPISAAIAIGSGGPFGAEGPIIMTGGAFGSLLAQWVKLTDAERTTLLVAGAAAGMSATFAAPFAAVLLAVELMLFEWRPRSLVPVAFASVTAAVLRVIWLGAGPLFPLSPEAIPTGVRFAVLAAILGAVIGLAASALSRMMYGFEDMFGKLPVHWMWWPAIGGLGVGIGGLFFPHGLGVGYDNIAVLLAGHATLALIFGVIVFKSLMWAFSLGSGTSGGVLAPLLMIGASLGALSAHLLHMPEGTLALLGMGAMLAGALGSPLTAIVFSIELTHALPTLLPLVVACIAAYTITSLIMPRSILTEKLGRRGHHLTREYGVDPLEMVSVEDAMTDVADEHTPALTELPPVYSFNDETCRSAAERMATTGQIRLAVLDRESMRPRGYVSLEDLLLGRRRYLKREETRERVFRLMTSRTPKHPDLIVTREEHPVEHVER